MAEACELPSSSSFPPHSPPTLTPKDKPVVVRVKRKASQTPIDALWLEIRERPPKKALLDIGKLSFSDSINEEKEKSATRKVLVQHVETISSSEDVKDLLDSCLATSIDSKEFNRKIKERKHMVKQDRRHEQLRTSARHKHEVSFPTSTIGVCKCEAVVRSARFEQIWKSRRAEGERQDDLDEKCHLYDVVRVDDEDQAHVEDAEDVSVEDKIFLCNYLPLIREHLPAAAKDIQFDIFGSAFTEDGYVYDIYTTETEPNVNAKDVAQYPLVQLNDDDEYFLNQWDSEYETDDSNAENNPLNDYPDEETSEDEDKRRLLSEEEEEHEREIIHTSEEEGQDWRWGYRRD